MPSFDELEIQIQILLPEIISSDGKPLVNLHSKIEFQLNLKIFLMVNALSTEDERFLRTFWN
jgi:hypothetical protein